MTIDFAKILSSETFDDLQEQLDKYLETIEAEYDVISIQYQVGEYVSALIHYRDPDEDEGDD